MTNDEGVMNRTRTFALATGLFTVASAPLLGQGKGHSKSSSPPVASRAHENASTRRASNEDVQTIRSYYRTDRGNVKPIPPGILRNLVRGQPLPPGIDRTRIPDDLNMRLYPRPGSTWYVVGDRLVLVDANGRVVDIVRRR
jgi:hypothetical protein